ncbi:MAG: 2-oxoacid:acceptor oxidoreductase family protein [Dehalococcoidales bacterium]
MAETKQIRFCGFGGQGIVLGGKILGNASISAGKWVAGLSTYGGAARGGVCDADIIISDDWIIFPQVRQVDVLVAMSQGAYNKNIGAVNQETGLVIYDTQLVSTKEVNGLKQIGIPATETAVKELNNKQVANVVLLGAAVEITGMINKDDLVEAIKKAVRERFLDLNIKAVDLGFKLGKEATGKAK